MGSDLTFNRPVPIRSGVSVVPFTKRMDPQASIDHIVGGRPVLVRDFYRTGLMLLSELKRDVNLRYADQSYEGQRANRTAFRELSNRILIQVKGNRLNVRKAPEIGWLEILYPDCEDFMIPFSQAQGLNSAWQWFQRGISIPVLKDKLFPFYGTYFPTRFEHLLLLDQWLEEYEGSKISAVDIGVGCGVVTFQLLDHGFAQVSATDSNPNAIHGMREALRAKAITSEVELFLGDLFAGCDTKADLIVFNPPWLPLANDHEGIDQAMYYDGELFPRFFSETAKHLKPEGRLVLLFSNLARITNQAKSNPIEDEIKYGGRFQKEVLLKSKVKAASTKTRRNQNWREEELVELWVLKPH